MYQTQVKAVLFAVTSATSDYRFLGSTPFEVASGINEITGVPGINLAYLATCS